MGVIAIADSFQYDSDRTSFSHSPRVVLSRRHRANFRQVCIGQENL